MPDASAITVFGGQDFNSTFTHGTGSYEVNPSQIASAYVASLKSTAPEMMWLPNGQIGPGYMLRKPVLLNIERDDDDECIVTDSFSSVYGNARTINQGVQDYCLSLMDYYDLLAEHACENVESALLFARLCEHVYKVSA